jgi:protein SCO1/2
VSPARIRIGALAVALVVSLGIGWWLSEWLIGATAPTFGVSDRGERGTPAIGGPFTLVDGDGKVWTDRDFAGRAMLIYFGFTHCPDVCPTSLAAVGEALDALGPDAARVQPLFVTVDPERDHGQQLKDYARAFDERILGLGGSIEQVSAAARAYRVYFKKVPGKSADDYQVDHTSILFMMDAAGRFVTHFPHGATGAEIAAGMRRHL